MSSIFSLVVCFIGIKIIFYNNFYFHFEIKISFKINFLLFIFSILLLINRNRILILIIGWDGLGISSFYLISFYSNIESVISSLITFFFNRLGDSFIIVFFSIIILISTNLIIIRINTLIITILFIGTITKRSQIPFGI
jgi:NADH:ubiquinone oxidoreductase subunit 5 (subunit L)/multisubunit Na+/H+ antiporter MnhA subunit